jgi:hypothetical protein
MLDFPVGWLRPLPAERPGGTRMAKRIRAREAYERPRVVRVRVVSGEMAVTACKTKTTRGGPTIGCQRGNCRTFGS